MLDEAAADADAGAGLAQRTRRFGRLAAVDATFRARLPAAHLAHRPPATGGVGEQEYPRATVVLHRTP
ncbi:hypothetical protein [Streptomyces sp. NPDC056188]|uniref:hypothetical protein n=1 Tax=Streptomyces sp. NPDC056188 TaxID=3345740 RepID=UPI0035E3BA8E